MNLKERLKLEEKESKNLIKAYWRFAKKPTAKQELEDEEEEFLGEALGKLRGAIIKNSTM